MLDNIKQILHPTDFSEPAQNAFNYARHIAKKHDAELVVMHSVHQSFAYGSEEMLQQVVKRNQYNDLSIDTRIDFGETVPGILKYAGDLIVIGSTGRSKMGKVLFGSISSEVMLKSPVPVLVIPPDRPYSNFDNIVFATDYRDCDLKNLQELTAWANIFNAEITVLHIASEDNLKTRIKFRGFKEIAGEEINYSHINFRLIYESDFYTGMSAFLHGQPDVLVVQSRYKKSFLQTLINPNHIQQTVYTKVPILVLPGEDKMDKSKLDHEKVMEN